jgi:hypothetical protein
MASTYIKSEGAMWIAGKKKFASDSFVIFQRVRRTGQELDDGTTADKNYIWLSTGIWRTSILIICYRLISTPTNSLKIISPRR